MKDVKAVVLAQEYIKSHHADLEFSVERIYQSHEGYTRSFVKRFSITPSEYRKRKIAIPIFTQHPANHYYILKEGQTMDTTSICTVERCDSATTNEKRIISRRACK